MKKHYDKKKKRYTDLAVIFSTVILFVVIFSVYFYNVSLKFQINYATLYNETVLTKTTDFHYNIMKISNQLFTNKNVNAYLTKKSDIHDLEAVYQIGSTVNESTIGSYIDSFFISMPEDEIIYSNRAQKKMSYDEFLKTYPDYSFALKKIPGGISLSIAELNEYEKYIVFSYNDYRGHILTYIISEKNYIQNYLNHSYPIFYGTIILNSDKEIITSNYNYDKSLIPIIKNSNSKALEYKGNNLIIKDSTEYYSVISILKLSDVLAKTLSTGAFLILLAIMLAVLIFVIVYYFYSQQKKLISSNRILESKHRDVNINRIFQKIFNGEMLVKTDSNDLKEYFSTKKTHYFLPLVVRIKDFDSSISDDDISLYKYGFENIINEVMENVSHVKTVNMGLNLIGILLYSATPFNYTSVIGKTNFFANAIKTNFDIEVFVTIGNMSGNIKNVQGQIASLIEAQNYSFIKTDRTLLLSDTERSETLEYPEEIQRKIIEKIKTYDMESVKSYIEEFSHYIIKNNCADTKKWYFNLFFAISDEVRNTPDIFVKYNTLETLLSCETIFEISDLLIGSIEYSKPTENPNMKNNFVEETKNIIEKEFSNPDFCVQSAAEYFNITAAHFGKKFKQHFNNVTFNKYLLEQRLNYAIKLLRETDFTNAKIAKMCGFNSENYFYTIFKKNIGSNPKEYKKQYQSIR